jgi:hypothetical protein
MNEARPATSLRVHLAGISALVVVGFVLGSSLGTVRFAAQASEGERVSERAAVRELAATFAKAVRQLVGSDQHKPIGHAAIVAGCAAGISAAVTLASASPDFIVRSEVRLELLDLPPPARTL